jgi:hypothetical protein
MATPDGFIRLQEELTTDPLVVGYAGMTDIQVSASLRAQTRPGPSTVDQLRAYFLLEKRSGVPLYGRLALVARSNVGDDPIGEATVLTLDHIASALTMINILNPVSNFSLDLADSRFDAILNALAAGNGAKVIGPADKTAIQAFSTNSLSRAQELNIPSSEGEIAFVRSL